MKTITYISGGSRSGKSRHALCLARQFTGRKAYIATAQALDAEMEERIRKHRRERSDQFLTLEEPLDLAAGLAGIPANTEVAVIDCLTLWLSNLMHFHGNGKEDFPEVGAFLQVLNCPPCSLIIVSNEVGMGIVPGNEMSRRFRDLAGRLNQQVAAKAQRAMVVISGIPLVLKDKGRYYA
jgi:adenosylcobinamide kinase/adenosylcobinamide-phosphate guanylyltransferase